MNVDILVVILRTSYFSHRRQASLISSSFPRRALVDRMDRTAKSVARSPIQSSSEESQLVSQFVYAPKSAKKK